MSKEFLQKLREKGLYDSYIKEVKYEKSIKSEIKQGLLESKIRKLKRQLQEMSSSVKKMKQKAAQKLKSFKVDKTDKKFEKMSKEMKIDYYYVFAFKVYIRALIQGKNGNQIWADKWTSLNNVTIKYNHPILFSKIKIQENPIPNNKYPSEEDDLNIRLMLNNPDK